MTLLTTSAIVAATMPATGFAKPAQQQDGIDAQPDATTAAPDSGEIVVTAQKREQRLQDVPAAVSVVDTGALAQTNQSRLRDFFSSVPGFQASPSPGGGGTQTLVIRGISSGTFSNPTVGIMIDEVPFGAAVTEFSPEVDPADLERIEVLRGPQGTLYGASSLGGLVKFVTTEPSTTRVFGKVEAGINGVSHGSSVGYALRGAINLPLAETFAIRVSGFTRKDPGYIDNPILGKNDVNDFSSRGGRISALWKATDNVSVKLSALFQRSIAQGQNEEVSAAGLGNYQTNYILDTGRSTKNIRAYSAVIQADLGPINLTSVTAYSTFEATAAQDYTSIPPWGTLAANGFGVPGAPSRYRANVKRPTQELRATFRTGPMIDWLLGGFYSDEQTFIRQAITAQAVDGTTAGTIFRYEQPINFREYAVFANPTVRLSDKFSVQFGGRYSWQTATYEAVTQSGSLYGGNTIVLPELVRRDKVFTYLVTPQYRFSSDLMLYARVATGYRPGRSNSANPNPLIPRVAAPDRTTNYEIGVKGDLIDNMLTYDVSLYQIDWKKVQLVQIDPVSSLSFTSNAGRARSKGAEVSLTLRPGSGFNLSGWLSYNKSVLTEGVVSTAAYAPTGATLPYSPRFSANASIDKRFDISADVTGTLGATFSHVSGREGTFVATPARAIYPAYSQFDLRAGLQYADWSLTLYARNVTDKRGLIGGGAGAYPPSAFVYIQPRSFGASLGKAF
ncbi:TonB-dependent receptor [Sphingopyxis sp. MSC1_008]|uniref:TonB-dependent receptor n=1 Tax=Sphingopyxis sp. MSC1_008 TaxID=2909265 RepID=UPI0020C14EB8|nr:TonB-dependent receptor [Sphingopyxis sp. MSC1_008]